MVAEDGVTASLSVPLHKRFFYKAGEINDFVVGFESHVTVERGAGTFPECSGPLRARLTLVDSPCQGPCILVAEDDCLIRKSLTNLLAGRGFRVLDACDGAEGIRIAQDFGGPIHLLVTDVDMPNLNGHELVMELRKSHPDLMVVILSSHAEQDFPPDSCYNLFIRKPINMDLVAATVARLVPHGDHA